MDIYIHVNSLEINYKSKIKLNSDWTWNVKILISLFQIQYFSDSAICAGGLVKAFVKMSPEQSSWESFLFLSAVIRIKNQMKQIQWYEAFLFSWDFK